MIIIRADTAEDAVWIAVTDTGAGIAPEYVDQVCDRAWQVNQFTTTNGRGLGLAIVQRLVKLQGGKLAIRSQIRQGSTFKFSLPLLDHPQ
jgi:signal transduction histidine kinase